MKWEPPLVRPDLPRIMRRSKLVVFRPEHYLSRGVEPRRGLSKIVRHFPSECHVLNESTSQLKSCVAVRRTTGTIRRYDTSLITPGYSLRSRILRREAHVNNAANGRQHKETPDSSHTGSVGYTDIQCTCCFGLCDFEKMAQCQDGHLICVDCLNSYAREAAHGTGKTTLQCTETDCTAVYPQSELERCVQSTFLRKLEDRIQEENINKARLENLARCAKCNFAAVVPPTMVKFQCLQDTCRQTTCIKCGKCWNRTDHKSCLAVPHVPEHAHERRLEYEERMTGVRIRVCPICHLSFTKASGCNRVVCRCGTSMCYLCRLTDVDFTHYCPHPRCPGKACTSCNRCSLWADSEEIDETTIGNVRREARNIIPSFTL